MLISTEALGYWYFRLNGFLTIVNFLVHPETHRDNRTEVDILGVRFPFRSENFRRPMVDHTRFRDQGSRPYLVISEVKSGVCDLNGPWTDPERRNVHKVLAAIGAFPPELVDDVAQALYSEGFHSDDSYLVSLFCIGDRENSDLRNHYRNVPQVSFDEILRFIHGRLCKYQREKADHDKWDDNGKLLWKTAMSHKKNVEGFIQAVLSP